MIERAWTDEATETDRQLAAIFGDVYITLAGPPSWLFGESLRMVLLAVTVPSMAVHTTTSPRMTLPTLAGSTMANPVLEA